jgi:hypothetical protein
MAACGSLEPIPDQIVLNSVSGFRFPGKRCIASVACLHAPVSVRSEKLQSIVLGL